MVSQQEGWAVGNDGLILHYIDGKWQEIISPTDKILYALDMLNENEGWAVGRHGTILHYQQGEWQQVPLDIEGVDWDGVQGDLYDIDMVDEDTGWAVGYSNLLLRYQQGTWHKVDPITDESLLTIAAPSSDEAWATTTKGGLLHYQQGQWQAVERPGRFNILAIEMLNEYEGIAVGGGILHYTNK